LAPAFVITNIVYIFQNQAILMRGLTVQSLPLQLEFPGNDEMMKAKKFLFLFQLSLMFVSKAGAYLCEAPEMNSTL
jgi:hypothetical protein